MSHSNDDTRDKKKPEDASPEPSASDKRSGRVAYDSRGNPIWEWQLETGVFSRDVNTQKLKKLDLGELSIADTGILPQPPGLEPNPGKARGPAPAHPKAPSNAAAARGKDVPGKSGGGFNPYDSGSSGSGRNPYDTSSTGNRNLGNTGNRNVGGFNPYDSTGRPPPGGDTNPYDNARVGNRLNPAPPPPERRRTPADLRKLDQEIKEQRKKLKD